MELLVCVINDEDKLDQILAGFAALGVTGATVIDSHGMAGHLPEDAPVVVGLKDLMSRSRPGNKTILSVIESQETIQAAIEMIRGSLGDIEKAGSGVAFTVPVTRAVGLTRRGERNRSDSTADNKED
jgi:nitrogen regulatory protein PII